MEDLIKEFQESQEEQPTAKFTTPTKEAVVEFPVDERITESKPLTTIEKIKNVHRSLSEVDGSLDRFVSLGEFTESSFNAILGPEVRKEFEILNDEEIQELSASYGRSVETKEPGALESSTFAITEDPTVNGKVTFASQTTIDDVKDAAREAGLQHQVNFDMMQELRESVYKAKFELDKVVGVKDEHFKSIEDSLKQAMNLIEDERSQLVEGALASIITDLKNSTKVEELNPEDRKLFWQALHNLECAKVQVNKAGFKAAKGIQEEKVQEAVVLAEKLWPKIKESTLYDTLSKQILML